VPTWMAVEDEADISEVVMSMFEAWGFSGLCFSDGNEAIAWIDQVDAGLVNEELPELAMIDIRLPTSSGPKIGARIRNSKKLGNIAVVLITAYRLNHAEQAQILLESDADSIIYKPLPDMPQLRSTLDNILAARKGNKVPIG
jgi:CheY-like chemotaxis protein